MKLNLDNSCDIKGNIIILNYEFLREYITDIFRIDVSSKILASEHSIVEYFDIFNSLDKTIFRHYTHLFPNIGEKYNTLIIKINR